MKTPSAPGDPTLHGRTLFNPGASPSQSTFSRPAQRDHVCPSSTAQLITNPVILHSSNPYCTAVFCAVPRNQIFSLFYIPPACSFVCFVSFVVPSSGSNTASFPGMLTSPSQ